MVLEQWPMDVDVYDHSLSLDMWFLFSCLLHFVLTKDNPANLDSRLSLQFPSVQMACFY